MDNIENYLYLAFAVIYIISRIIKASKKQKGSQPQQTRQPGQPQARPINQQQPKPKKTFSFEDILKEFEKNLAGEEEETAYEKPLPVKEIEHKKPAPEPVRSIESKPNKYESYQEQDYATSGFKKEDDKETVFARNEKYSITEDVASDYVKMLQDPEGFKNAVVLSEIINRKYF